MTSRRRFSHGAVGFALTLGQKLAIDNASERGRSLLPVAHHGHLGVIQILQVIVGLTHPWLLPLMSPSEEELGTLVQEAAYRGHQRDGEMINGAS